jgi:Flp pilus assembly protein TadG
MNSRNATAGGTGARCSRNAAGHSVSELALSLPFLVVLLLVVADFARLFYASIGVANAARAGTQYGAQNYTTAIDYPGMKTAAQNDGQNISGLSASATSFCTCNGAKVACIPAQCSQPKLYVQVTTTATFTTLINYPGIPSSVPLSSTSVMPVE